jgi:hypothetical protein
MASSIAVWGLRTGSVRTAAGSAGDHFVLLQVFMAVVAATGLLLGATILNARPCSSP